MCRTAPTPKTLNRVYRRHRSIEQSESSSAIIQISDYSKCAMQNRSAIAKDNEKKS